jgi:alanine racemase
MSAAPARVAEVDLGAIAENVRRIRAVAGTPHHLAVVKADGYGHGAVPVARAALAGGADWLGVADVEEALALRAAGIEAPLLAWLHGAGADFGAAAAARVDLGVSSRSQLEQVAATAPGAAVQIKLETGLSRNGVAPEEWADVLRRAGTLEREGRLAVRGVFSHLANTSPESDAAAARAFADGVRLARDAGLHPELVHLAATAAALRRDQSACTMVRTGIGIYGLSPFDDGDAAAVGLHPAMTLRTEVAATRRVQAGAGVSYDHTWRAPRATNLALVPVGYADGIPRSASNRAAVTIAGRRRPVRGRIAMDQLVVELGDDDVPVGEPVTVFGDPASGVPSAADWAGWAGTINYEIVTRIGPRVARRYVGA